MDKKFFSQIKEIFLSLVKLIKGNCERPRAIPYFMMRKWTFFFPPKGNKGKHICSDHLYATWSKRLKKRKVKSIYIFWKRNIYIHRQHGHLCTPSDAIYKKTLGWPREMIWGRLWEGGSEWGTHVHLWRIQVNVWQNQYSIVK